MVTKQQYVEYLICIIGNYIGSHLAEHLDKVGHDVVTNYLRSEYLSAHGSWELVDRLLQDNPDASFCGWMTVCKTSAVNSSSNWRNSNIVAQNLVWPARRGVLGGKRFVNP